jgi:PAS domain S-box-containing protein
VCLGEAQAFFEDHVTVFSLLLNNPPCPGTPLRMLPMPDVKIQLGMGATRESGAAADAIREEISAMARDGSLGRIVGVWSHAASQELASLIKLQQAKSHLRWYRISFVAVAGLLAFASWSAAGYRRQKMKSQAYCRALGQAERNVRLAADSLSEMVMAYDMHRSLIYANSGAVKLTGYGPEELQGADPLTWTHPEDRPRVLALWDQAFDGQTVDQVVYRLFTKDGTVKWAAGCWGPVVDEMGHQVGVRATCLDITERMVAEQALQETTQKFRTIVEEIAERKRAEQALLESEERTRLAMQAGRMFAFEWNPRTDEVRRSYNLAEIAGSGADETREAGGEFIKRVHPEDQERLSQTIRGLTPANDTYEIQYRVIRPGGEIATLQQNGRAFFDSGAVMIRLIGMTADITERKRAETALRDSEERFRVIFSQAAVGIAQTGVDGKWLLVNDRLCEILGYTQAELSGKNFLELTHPDDRDTSLTALRRLLAGDISSWSAEKRYLHKEGDAVWVRLCVSMVRHQDNRPQYFVAVVEDVTDRMEAERALRDSERRLIESEERLKSAQRLARVGHWVWDIKAGRVFLSEELCRIFGRPANYAPDYLNFLQAVRLQDRERVDQAVRDSLAGKKGPDLLEFQITRPDGEARTVACTSEVLRDPADSPVRMSGACQDVTDQRLAEAASRRSHEEIAHLNRVAAMGELTASLAHELNQPLAAILSNAQAANRFLNRESPDLAQVRECLTDIVADDKRAGAVIKTLRALLRKGESQATLVDLNEVVRDAIRLLGTEAMLRHALVNFEPLPALCRVLGDRTQLHQVVLNLIVNGLEATAERPPDNRWVLVRTAESEGGGVQLTVEDSGKGIAESDLARVFEPFHTTKQEGLGMGLSISRTILQAHGGHIWAENRAGHGAIVHCMLPVPQQGAAAATL